MTVVERPDLSTRTSLSKSALVGFDLCQTKSWYAIHEPRPMLPSEKVTFGSAVDAAVEVVIAAVRSGQRPEYMRAMEAAVFVIERDAVMLDLDEVKAAVLGFAEDIVPRFDWAYCRTQASITADLEGLGETNGHPDIVFADHAVLDVKTASRAKTDGDPSTELGLYGLLVEAETGEPVPWVGYVTWVRIKRPYWQLVQTPFNDEYRRWAYEQAASFVRAKRADAIVNAKAASPINATMTGGPKFPSLCSDCQYNPVNGGPCVRVWRQEEPRYDDAA